MVMRRPRFGWGFNKRLAASESRRGVKQESLRCGKRMRWAWPASAAALFASCWWIPRPAVAPLRTVSLPGAGTAAGDLLVFLPGRGDRPEDFERRGLLAAARAAGVEADVVAVDAHLAYYYKRTIADRLWEDVIVHARGRGYARIWLV